jgi:hypothetical protein
MKYRVIIAAFGLSAVGVSAPLPGEVSAQIVEVPTFQVGPATPGEETRSIDVAVGTDGSLVAVWLATDAMGRRRIENRPLSPDGTALDRPSAWIRRTSSSGASLPKWAGVPARPLGQRPRRCGSTTSVTPSARRSG